MTSCAHEGQALIPTVYGRCFVYCKKCKLRWSGAVHREIGVPTWARLANEAEIARLMVIWNGLKK